MKSNIILASSSPRRKELLSKIFDDFTVVSSDCDESISDISDVFSVPEILAVRKAKQVFKSFPNSLVIGADTCVIADGRILGKPKDSQDAYNMLSALSGNTHYVVTGCAILRKDKTKVFSVCTEVAFYELTDSEIREYINTGDPFDKAGGYGIQSKGYALVKGIKGDYFNVVGLPIAELKRNLELF